MDVLSLAVGVAAGMMWREVLSRLVGQSRPVRLVRRSAMAVPAEMVDDALAEQWRLHICQFALAADMVGWSLRAMSTAGVVTRPAWTSYTSLLRRAGVILIAERQAPEWSPGWNRHHLRCMLRHGLLALPYPARRPPAVRLGVAPAQMTQHSTGALR